jgi:peroxiredoxin (alkyl hydroperoxide reductase subunit C)
METLVGKSAPSFKLNAWANGEMTECDSNSALKGKWTVLLFYPLDFTFVCPTELLAYDAARDRFADLNAQVFGVSVDSHFTHKKWALTPRAEGGVEGLKMPLLADIGGNVAEAFGIKADGGMALRGLFLVDPEGTVQHATVNNLPVGRNVEETIRVIQAFQYTAEHGEVCPANWTPGEKSMKPNESGLREYFAS